jgi:hypothetical protein
MVKIAIAGGSGGKEFYKLVDATKDLTFPLEVASEVIGALLATKKHDITILSTRVSMKVKHGRFHDYIINIDSRRLRQEITRMNQHGVP